MSAESRKNEVLQVRKGIEKLRGRKEGFSIMELIIVVAIIAIISAGVVMIFNEANLRADAKTATAMNDFKALQKAIAFARSLDGIDITIQADSTVRDGTFIVQAGAVTAVEKYLAQPLDSFPATYSTDAALMLIDSDSIATLALKN